MKLPTTEEIINEVQELKHDIKSHDLQMGIGGYVENRWHNKLNKIIRMLRQPQKIQFAKTHKSEVEE